MPQFFDAHSHIQDPAFDADREEVIARMHNEGVWSIVVGTDLNFSKQAVALASNHEHLFAAIGIHPTDKFDEPFVRSEFDALAESKKVVAVGECGLDYYRMQNDSPEERARQRDLFETQLHFAVDHGLPLMIHCRDAHEDMIAILRNKKKELGEQLWGNIHFFTAPLDIAKQYLELGFSLSFSGVITFARDYDDVVKYAPLDMILSETDTPYAAPIPHRGKRNEPVFIKETIAKIAELRGEDLETVERALVENAWRIFRLSERAGALLSR